MILLERPAVLLAWLGGAGIAALIASFAVINIGLRLLPEGRAFLAAARAEGRLLANPRRDSAGPVKAVFALAVAAAALAFLAVMGLGAVVSEPVPSWPIPLGTYAQAAR